MTKIGAFFARAAARKILGADSVEEVSPESVDTTREWLTKAFEAGERKKHMELRAEIQKHDDYIRIVAVHTIGDHIIVEHKLVSDQILFGIWSRTAHMGPRIVTSYYSIDEALMASLALNHGAMDWTEANDRSFYAGLILGMERGR